MLKYAKIFFKSSERFFFFTITRYATMIFFLKGLVHAKKKKLKKLSRQNKKIKEKFL